MITEGKTIDECLELLQDALREMILAYRQQGKEVPNALCKQAGLESKF